MPVLFIKLLSDSDPGEASLILPLETSHEAVTQALASQLLPTLLDEKDTVLLNSLLEGICAGTYRHTRSNIWLCDNDSDADNDDDTNDDDDEEGGDKFPLHDNLFSGSGDKLLIKAEGGDEVKLENSGGESDTKFDANFPFVDTLNSADLRDKTSAGKSDRKRRKNRAEVSKVGKRRKRVLICEIACGLEFTGGENLARHQRSSHPDQFCSMCRKAFLEPHVCPRPYHCEVCGQRFAHKKTFINHQDVHSGLRPFVCDLCGKACRQKEGLLSHMKTHKPRARFPCDMCEKSYGTRYMLEQHKMIHLGVISTTCEYCSKVCTSRSNLVAHLQNKHEKKEHVCHICNKAYGRISRLKEHMLYHSETKEHKCQDCPMAFHHKNALRKHWRNVHGEKIYACEVCKTSFSTVYYLKRHMDSHEKSDKSLAKKSSEGSKVDCDLEEKIVKFSPLLCSVVMEESPSSS